jgi:hypothetical protein
MFKSTVTLLSPVVFPEFSGIRVMMMPFLLSDVKGSLPDTLAGYLPLLTAFEHRSYEIDPVAYLTIDEALVPAGETHRRPGLHVDGVGPDGFAGGWGGGGGGWGKQGMVVAASHTGSHAWEQEFHGDPGFNGDCAHLRNECREDSVRPLLGGFAYFCGPLTVHEATRMPAPTKRSFLRISMPNSCPWYDGYTENPRGVKPTGPIHPARVAEMAYRP